MQTGCASVRIGWADVGTGSGNGEYKGFYLIIELFIVK